MSFERVPVAAHETSHVRRALAAIAKGQRVVLPTETVYGLAADPHLPAAVERLRRWKGRSDRMPFTHHLAAAQQLETVAAPPPRRVRKLLERYWPGPLTLVLPAPGGGTVGVRVPASAFTQDVISALGHSLFLTSVNRSGEEPAAAPDDIAAAFAADVDVLFDAGPPQLRMASTVVRCTGPKIEVLREGILAEKEILTAAATTVLFVCSGNTCRSPMAETIARSLASHKLGVPESGLLAMGYQFLSAGTGTLPGMAASEGAGAALREVGLAVGDHRTRALTRSLARAAERIFCMSQAHCQRVLDMDPALTAKTALLDPRGEEIEDPFGRDLEHYRAARVQIQAALERRMPELLALV